jgi:hypothetical protein
MTAIGLAFLQVENSEANTLGFQERPETAATGAGVASEQVVDEVQDFPGQRES